VSASARIFIDGQAGSTGLEVTERLTDRDDIELVDIDNEQRKRPEARRECFESADVVVLCLPDEAAQEAVTLSEKTRFIDASTAHRVHDRWTYGLPELTYGQRDSIRESRRVSNPGCYATGFLLSIRPLVDETIVSRNALIRTHALSGYSGGGRQLIEKYSRDKGIEQPTRPYAFNLNHKHVPEMRHYAGLESAPFFMPTVGNFFRGMLVQTPFFLNEFNRSVRLADIVEIFQTRYADEPFVRVIEAPLDDELDEGFLSPTACNGSNRIDIMVFGHEQQVLVVARLDNLGKGAAGAAVQNLNLMLGRDESSGISE
jgi:N-acetyl-gamma-glutamyl-phosphate reductase